MNNLILAIILSFLPISEVRGGMPVVVHYALSNGFSFPLIVALGLLVILVNILGVLFAFFFLDFIHEKLMRIKIYRKTFDYYMERVRKKADKMEGKMGSYGFLALALFVAIPLPVTGGWSGALIAWYLGLDRKKSILAISLGVFAAGLIMFLFSLGLFSLF